MIEWWAQQSLLLLQLPRAACRDYETETRRLHALGSGLGVREYADKVGKSKSEIDRNRSAASVMQFCPHMGTELNSKDRHLAELHAAPRWLWRCAGNERPRPSGDVAGPLTKAPSR